MKKMLYYIFVISIITVMTGCTKKSEPEIGNSTEANIMDTTAAVVPEAQSSQQAEKPLMIVLNNKLYKLLDKQEEPMGDSGVVSGMVLSSVPRTMQPQQNCQSNFGEVGSSYSLSEEDDEVVVSVEDRWQRFARTKFVTEDGFSYDYMLTLTGTLPNASTSSVITVFTNDEKLTFDAVAERLLSSQYDPEAQEAFYYLEELSDVQATN